MSSGEDLDAFTLPWNWKPGSDLVSKLLFNDPMVVNLIVQSLLGTDVPADSYTVASNEWADGTKSDVVFVFKGKPMVTRPPILIEFQDKVSCDFMARLIKYSLSAYSRYKIYPIVLIFAIKGFSSAVVEKDFTVASKKFFLKTDSKFWAKECLLLSSKSILGYINQSPMNPMVAMEYFLTSGAVSLASLKHQSDPTVRLLYQTSKQLILSDMDEKDKSVKSMGSVLENIKRQFENIVDEDENTPRSAVKKIKDCIKESLELINEQSKHLERKNTAESSQSSIADNKYTEKDILFVESMSKPGKNKDWKRIYNEGKAQGLFKSYTSSHNLKTSYHHLQKRKKSSKT